jgi:hypothetical protein
MEPVTRAMLLSLLPADLVARVLESDGASDVPGWADALISACCEFDMLSLLGAAVLELSSDQAACAFDEFVTRFTLRPFTEKQLRDITAHAVRFVAFHDLDEQRTRSLATKAANLTITGYERIHSAHRLRWLVRFLADSSSEEEHGPLHGFLRRLEKPQDSGEPPTDPGSGSKEPTLMIAMNPRAVNQYSATVWGLIGAKAAEGRKLYSTDEAALALEDLRWRIDDVRREFQFEYNIPNRELTIEFILPSSMICEAIHQWTVKIGRQHDLLGGHFRVVVRSRERLFDPELKSTWPNWREKWAVHFDQGQMHPLPKCGSEDRQEILRQLCESHVSAASITAQITTSSQNAVDLCVDAGIPVALWFRDTVPADDMARLLPPPTEEHSRLPQWAKTLRGRERETHPSWRLMLLWDDPSRLPPDLQLRKQSPRRRAPR